MKAEQEKEEKLFEIRKLQAEKLRALEIARLEAQVTELQGLLSFSVTPEQSQSIVNQIFAINKQIREKEFEAQKLSLERELELSKDNAEARERIILELEALELKRIEARKAAELKLIDDVAKAREEAIKDEFAKRAALREQGELQSESEFLKKEAEQIGVFFGNQRKLQRERDRELRRQEIERAKERSALANEQFKETERLYLQELATFGKVRNDTEIKYQESLAARQKAE
ncbi:MAG: hypothetical protein RMJ44_12515, partial [Cytophagales bacterium]|nr:hypothetical protein [Cytophagales bacterium]